MSSVKACKAVVEPKSFDKDMVEHTDFVLDRTLIICSSIIKLFPAPDIVD